MGNQKTNTIDESTRTKEKQLCVFGDRKKSLKVIGSET